MMASANEVQRSANSIHARLDGLGALPDALDVRDYALSTPG